MVAGENPLLQDAGYRCGFGAHMNGRGVCVASGRSAMRRAMRRGY
jgi:hypothetical protein